MPADLPLNDFEDVVDLYVPTNDQEPLPTRSYSFVVNEAAGAVQLTVYDPSVLGEGDIDIAAQAPVATSHCPSSSPPINTARTNPRIGQIPIFVSAHLASYTHTMESAATRLNRPLS